MTQAPGFEQDDKTLVCKAPQSSTWTEARPQGFSRLLDDSSRFYGFTTTQGVENNLDLRKL